MGTPRRTMPRHTGRLRGPTDTRDRDEFNKTNEAKLIGDRKGIAADCTRLTAAHRWQWRSPRGDVQTLPIATSQTSKRIKGKRRKTREASHRA